MSDTYQATYDAIRSKVTGCDVGKIVQDAIRQAFDISYTVPAIAQGFHIAADEIANAAKEHQRPFVTLRPTISRDGNQWCALYGENLHDGVAGFGDTPQAASIQFDIEWLNAKAAS